MGLTRSARGTAERSAGAGAGPGFTESPRRQERTGSSSRIRELMGMDSRPLTDGTGAPLGNDLGFAGSSWMVEGSECWDWGREGTGREFQGFSSRGSGFIFFISIFFIFIRIYYRIIWDGRDHPGSVPAIPGFPGFGDELGMAEAFQALG